jgi:hypothetical protein
LWDRSKGPLKRTQDGGVGIPSISPSAQQVQRTMICMGATPRGRPVTTTSSASLAQPFARPLSQLLAASEAVLPELAADGWLAGWLMRASESVTLRDRLPGRTLASTRVALSCGLVRPRLTRDYGIARGILVGCKSALYVQIHQKATTALHNVHRNQLFFFASAHLRQRRALFVLYSSTSSTLSW